MVGNYMKYTVLHGAKENCGDFLIRDSAIDFLKYHTGVSETEINSVDVVRKELSGSQIDTIAETDVAFLAGGPGYQQNFYPDTYPSLDDILDVTSVVLLGPGWKGQNEVGYEFTDESLNLLEQVVDQPSVPFLGARDLPSVRILQNHGLPAELTGCPAWYTYNDFPPNPKFPSGTDAETILMSTPPENSPRHLAQFIILIRMLSSKFPDARIKLVFHRGIPDQGFKPVIRRPWNSGMWKANISSLLYAVLNRISQGDQFEQYDAAGSSDFAQEYFDADLHVGYRVHAHIPSLSAGTPSFLIQIDGRGTGVSESLGTDADVFGPNGLYAPVQEIKKNIDSNLRNGFLDFDEVGKNIQNSYENMKMLV
jgi:hypothetical protein